jgi:hypothetical protein
VPQITVKMSLIISKREINFAYSSNHGPLHQHQT